MTTVKKTPSLVQTKLSPVELKKESQQQLKGNNELDLQKMRSVDQFDLPVGGPKVTFNKPRYPQGPYLKSEIKLDIGPHTKNGLRILGWGGKTEAGAAFKAATAEFVVSLKNPSEAYLNVTLLHDPNVEIQAGGSVGPIKGKTVATFDMRTLNISKNEVQGGLGPFEFTANLTDRNVTPKLTAIDASANIAPGASTTYTFSVEGLQPKSFEEVQRFLKEFGGEALDGAAAGYSSSYNQNVAGNAHMQQANAEKFEAAKKKLAALGWGFGGQ